MLLFQPIPLLRTSTTVTLSNSTTTAAAVAQIVNFYSPVGGDQGDQPISGVQWSGSYNRGLYSRIKRVTDVSVAAATSGSSNLYAGTSGDSSNCISNQLKMASEFKPYYITTAGNTGNLMIWYDVAIVRMSDILDSMKSLPLTKKFDATFRVYLNVGSVVSNISDSATYGSTTGNKPCMISSGSGNTFTNTCPLMHCAIANTPATATAIISQLSIGNAATTSISAVGKTFNLGGAPAHFLTSCRMYYPQIQLKPEKLDLYISSNRSKKLCWTSILNNNFNNISSNATFSALVQSGVTNPRGLLIVPQLSASAGSTVSNGSVTSSSSVTPFTQALSPFDTAPFTTSNISLINIQVAVGGVNVLANVLSYGYEDFIEQVSIYEKINGSDFGLSNGLINQSMWEHGYRYYYVDLSRAAIADLATPRNITVSFTNNCLQPIDIQLFTEYYREGVIDVETGILSV